MRRRFDSSEEYKELVMPSKSSFILADPDEGLQVATGTKTSPKKNKKGKGEEGGCC